MLPLITILSLLLAALVKGWWSLHKGHIWIPAAIAVVVILSIVLVVAVSIAELPTNVDASSSRVGFKSGDGTRTTMDIVFSCLSTMIICTISAIHFDLPGNVSSYFRFFNLAGPRWDTTTTKVLNWLLGLLMPEIWVGKACMQYSCALVDYHAKVKSYPEWTLKLSMFDIMRGFTWVNDPEINPGRAQYRTGAKLDRQKICKSLEREISDKSKANVLTKLIAIIQITRFLLEVIARAASSLPISPLEYFTCAQVFCALLMYVFWFDKPCDVETKISLDLCRKERLSGATRMKIKICTHLYSDLNDMG